MIEKKVCLLGSFAVGKTSLVARFVRGIFAERYLTTVGVKIDRKTVRVADREVGLIVWDLAGVDALSSLNAAYLRGASGYLLVADGTRSATLDEAMAIHRDAQTVLGPVPALLLVNKADLAADWEVDDDALDEARRRGFTARPTSALSGDGVEEAFLALTGSMVAP